MPNRLLKVALIALAIALSSFVVACSGDDGPTPDDVTPSFNDDPTPIEGLATAAPFPVEIPRSDGKALRLEAAPTRIVSLSPATTEIIYALGAEAALVGVDTGSDFPTAASAIQPRVTLGSAAAEQIASLDPDLILMNQDQGGLLAALDQRNLPVYFNDAAGITTIEQVFAQIGLIGKATGKSDEASALIATLGGRLQTVVAAVQGVNSTTSPRVFHELGADLRTASEGSLQGDLYRTLRAQNIARDGGGSPYPQLSNESVIASLPDVIVIAHTGATPDAVAARPGWADLPAVTDGRVSTIDPAASSRPGPRIIDALEALAKLVYPERFE